MKPRIANNIMCSTELLKLRVGWILRMEFELRDKS